MYFTGYHKLPVENLYWSKADDISNNIVPRLFSRNRYYEIKRFLHFNDNSSQSTNKLAKIDPLIEIVNENLKQFGLFSKYLSIDEQMIPFFGHHSMKMFIKGKPIRFGFKA